MEDLNGEGVRGNEIDIDRTYYEELIAKAILFRGMENLHGVRNSAIGQLRSAGRTLLYIRIIQYVWRLRKTGC